MSIPKENANKLINKYIAWALHAYKRIDKLEKIENLSKAEEFQLAIWESEADTLNLVIDDLKYLIKRSKEQSVAKKEGEAEATPQGRGTLH